MHITVKVVATDSAVAALSVAIAVALMSTSLSQHCFYHCCHNAVLVFAVTQRCAHRCPTAVGFLLCTQKITNFFSISKKNPLVLFSEPKKVPLFFFSRPKKIPASFIDPKRSLLAKTSDPKNHSDPPSLKM